MAINISTANNQASQLCGYADRLKQAKNQLNSYKSSLAANWQSSEVPLIIKGVDQTIAQLDSVIKQLNSLSSDIKNTAATLKREDDAAAAAARAKAAKQNRIAVAQKSYNTACDELTKLNKSRNELVAKIKNRPSLGSKYHNELDRLNKNIEAAKKKCEECKKALITARR